MSSSLVFVSYCLNGTMSTGIEWCVVEMAEPIADEAAIERLAALVVEARMAEWTDRPKVTPISWRRLEAYRTLADTSI